MVLVLITKLEHPCAEFLCLFCKHKFIGLIIKQGHSRGEGGLWYSNTPEKKLPSILKISLKIKQDTKIWEKKSILHAHLLLAKNTVYPV